MSAQLSSRTLQFNELTISFRTHPEFQARNVDFPPASWPGDRLTSDPISENAVKFSMDPKMIKNPIELLPMGIIFKKKKDQSMVRIGTARFGASSRLSVARWPKSVAICLSYHGSSMVSKRQVASLDKHQDSESYYAFVFLSTCMRLCATGHHGCLWNFMVCLRLSSLGRDS